jgi:hypothetical protein
VKAIEDADVKASEEADVKASEEAAVEHRQEVDANAQSIRVDTKPNIVETEAELGEKSPIHNLADCATQALTSARLSLRSRIRLG